MGLVLESSYQILGAKSLSRIGGLFGVPVIADECTTNQRRVSYARVLIEVDVSKPLPKVIPVEDKEDHVDDQAFFIKWVPYFCQKCRALGHICDE